MRDTLLSVLSSTHELFNIVADYLDGVWPREMMQTMMYVVSRMLSDDTDSDDDARDLICVIMR
jgi:hypothetical protein